VLDVALLVLLLAGLWIALQRSRAIDQRYGPHAAATGLWLLGWTLLVLSGLILTTRDAFPSLSHSGPLLRAGFAWSMLAGAWYVSGARLPSWIVPVGASLGFLGAGLSALGWSEVARWVGLASEVPPLLFAAARLGRGPAPLTLWSRSLSPLFVAMAGVMAAPTLVSGWRPDSPPVLALALVFAPALFAAQLRSAADANRERLRRERDVLEGRFSARTDELAAANRSLRREIERHELTDEALRESEQRHRVVAELSSDFTFDLDVSSDRGVEIRWVSGSFERITGRPPETLEGWGFVSLLAPTRQAETRTMVEGIRGVARTMETEHEIETPAGERRLLNIRVVSMEEAGGGLRVVGGARDVTEERRAQQLRSDLEHQLQDSQRLESLGVLTGGIAHDFNNLLSVILGNLRLALEDTPESSPAHVRLEKVRAAGEYAAELTEQMLAYSGKASITRVPTDLGLLAQEMEALLAAALPEGARLELEVGPACVVDGDATRLRQVLLNLVANGGESLSGGRGRVAVRIACDEGASDDPRGWFGDVPEAPSVILEVSDDGCGMDAELQRRIFDPFFTTKFSGRGLGLASVLGIARSHGGAIRVDSKPEQGSSLLVRLPRSSGTPAELTPVVRAESGCGHVLLIDDDESVVELAAEFLVRSGHTVETAIGGYAGVERFRAGQEEIDVVVLDLGMPDLDGGEVFEELRRIRPDVRVVLSTGYREEQAFRRFEASGVAAFLGKPYEPEQLIDAVARARASREV